MPPQPGVQMQGIQEAIEQVRQGFSDLDKSLSETRDLVEEQDLSPEFELVADHLSANVEDADQLLEDLELLLSMLPSSEDTPPSDGSGQPHPGQSNPEQKPGGKEPQQQNDSNNEKKDQPLGNQESDAKNPQQSGEDPPFAVQPIFMTPGQGGGSWGHLPPRLLQTLQNAQAEDLPLRYRGLLEEFHKKNLENL